jgi:hypothetical protein
MNSRRAIVFTQIEMLIAIAFLGTLAERAARYVAEPSNA